MRSGKLSIFIGIALIALAGVGLARGQGIVTGPSAFCHVTDGTFTSCPGGGFEWSDVTPAAFTSGGVLYADQADLDPSLATPTSPVDTLMLMYDETQRTMPLAPNEYVLVHFMSVEEPPNGLVMDHYNIHIFSDGTFFFIKNGVVQGPGRVTEIEGQRAAAGFGTSPNSAVPHVMAEYQIQLSEAGGASYSPDPLWWSSPPPSPCSATIATPTGAPIPPTMNVGQNAQFTGIVSPLPAPGTATVDYQWTVSGPIIKDYHETTNVVWSVDDMLPAHFQAQPISFYWKPLASQIDNPLTPAVDENAGPAPRTVQLDVTIQNAAGTVTCSNSVTINVERNAVDINKQAEDFYLTNHPVSTNVGLALNEHVKWHTAPPDVSPGPDGIFGAPGTPAGLDDVPAPPDDEQWKQIFDNPAYDGTLFFDFHTAYINRLNEWREEFGYPPVVVWDTSMTYPTGPDIDHTGRNAYSPHADSIKPTWFTITGGTLGRFFNSQPCDTAAGQTRLLNFKRLPGPDGILGTADDVEIPDGRKHLGCAVTHPWHNHVHGDVGGIMGSLQSPRDPIFWRWHAFIDTVNADFLSLSHMTPPEVIYQSPFRLFVYTTELPSISVLFSESVTDVKASDLLVNGFPAGEVTGSGAGPYVFTGGSQFAAIVPPIFLPFTPVEVVLGPGNITDAQRLRFAGASWSYIFTDPKPDSDEDGLINDLEVNRYRTSPVSPDTDGDGMPDGFEAASRCLLPLEEDADGDGDGDGIRNLDEFLLQSAPCPPPPRLLQPVFGDSDGEGVLDELDNCPAVPNEDQADREHNGIGEACQAGVVFSTAAWLQTLPDGSTFVEPTSLLIEEHPSLVEQIARIVDFRLNRDPTLDPRRITQELVDSQVAMGIVDPSDAPGIVDAVLVRLFGVVIPTFADVAVPVIAATVVILALNRYSRRSRPR